LQYGKKKIGNKFGLHSVSLYFLVDSSPFSPPHIPTHTYLQLQQNSVAGVPPLYVRHAQKTGPHSRRKSLGGGGGGRRRRRRRLVLVLVSSSAVCLSVLSI
jgi:hypothetical protein